MIGGALAIERVVRGRLELSPLAAALFLYSLPFAWGFLNFEFGFGVALCAIAAWLAMEDRRTVRARMRTRVFVLILFVAHLLALGIYGVTLGLHELWRAAIGEGLRPADAAQYVGVGGAGGGRPRRFAVVGPCGGRCRKRDRMAFRP